MKAYIENFKKYRFLLWELVKKGVKLKYRRSYLGILWTLLEPLMTMIVLSVVFGTLFGNKDPHFPVYILCGRLMYSFFSSATNGAMKAIRTNSGMIKKVYVPKYIYPLSSVLFNCIGCCINCFEGISNSLSVAGNHSADFIIDYSFWSRNDLINNGSFLQRLRVFMVCRTDDHYVCICNFL